MLIIPAEDTAQFLAPLPVSVISGVGPKAVAGLERIGVRTISQIREVPAATVARVLGPRTPEVLRLADGSDRTGLAHRIRDKSLGTERTWDEDLTDPREVRRRITIMADEVAHQLRRSGFVTRTVVLKLRKIGRASCRERAAVARGAAVVTITRKGLGMCRRLS